MPLRDHRSVCACRGGAAEAEACTVPRAAAHRRCHGRDQGLPLPLCLRPRRRRQHHQFSLHATPRSRQATDPSASISLRIRLARVCGASWSAASAAMSAARVSPSSSVASWMLSLKSKSKGHNALLRFPLLYCCDCVPTSGPWCVYDVRVSLNDDVIFVIVWFSLTPMPSPDGVCARCRCSRSRGLRGTSRAPPGGRRGVCVCVCACVCVWRGVTSGSKRDRPFKV